MLTVIKHSRMCCESSLLFMPKYLSCSTYATPTHQYSPSQRRAAILKIMILQCLIKCNCFSLSFQYIKYICQIFLSFYPLVHMQMQASVLRSHLIHECGHLVVIVLHAIEIGPAPRAHISFHSCHQHSQNTSFYPCSQYFSLASTHRIHLFIIAPIHQLGQQPQNTHIFSFLQSEH